MRPLATLVSLCAAAALLCDCSAMHNAQQAATDSFHKSFRTSFKDSFVKSCTAQGATTKLCDCVEASMERDYTDDQLMKMSSSGDDANKAVSAAAHVCQSQR